MLTVKPLKLITYLLISGNEYGITNVSSHGRVNITVIPPNKMGGAGVGPAVYPLSSSYGSHTSNSSTTNRYYPAASSVASSVAHPVDGYQDNSQHTSTLTTHNRTVKTTTDYNPPANSMSTAGGQLLQTSTPQSAHINNNGSAPTGDGLITKGLKTRIRQGFLLKAW